MLPPLPAAQGSGNAGARTEPHWYWSRVRSEARRAPAGSERRAATGIRPGPGPPGTPTPHVGTERAHSVTSGAGQITGNGSSPVTVAWQRRRIAAMANEDDLPVVTFGNLMSEGITLSRRGQHDKALGCFNDVRAPRPEGPELPTAGGASGGAAATGRGSVQAGEEAAGGPAARGWGTERCVPRRSLHKG